MFESQYSTMKPNPGPLSNISSEWRCVKFLHLLHGHFFTIKKTVPLLPRCRSSVSATVPFVYPRSRRRREVNVSKRKQKMSSMLHRFLTDEKEKFIYLMISIPSRDMTKKQICVQDLFFIINFPKKFPKHLTWSGSWLWKYLAALFFAVKKWREKKEPP